MESTERWRLFALFGLFGVIGVLLFARLVFLQVYRAADNREAVRVARDLREPLAAPRGTIFDRNGKPLAYDRPVREVRVEFQARVAEGQRQIPERTRELFLSRLVMQLMKDPGRQEAERTELRRSLRHRFKKQQPRLMPNKYPTRDYLRIEFLLCKDLDAYAVEQGLRAEARFWNNSREMPGRIHLYFLPTHKRTYPEREATFGPVGAYYLAAQRDRQGQTYVAEAHSGMESFSGLWPTPARSSEDGSYYSLDFKDARRGRYWAGLGETPQAPSEVHSTIDVDLQAFAQAQLREAAAMVRSAKDLDGKDYSWGAMILVHVPTGDVLATASYFPGRSEAAAADAVTQLSFEPGSVVKPLMYSWVLEKGRLDWFERIHCAHHGGRRWPLEVGGKRYGRVIVDDHLCRVERDGLISSDLTPAEALAQSSNIGAVKVGSRLTRDELIAWYRHFGFGQRTGLGLKGELAAGRRDSRGRPRPWPKDGVYLKRDTQASLSFGYEFNVTVAQLARAYLRLLSGRERDLRMVRGLRVQGEYHELPEPERGARFLRDDTIARMILGMQEVVRERRHHTGRHLAKYCREQGWAQPPIAGKTGTSDSSVRVDGVAVRQKSAAFVGFAPDLDPQYLCVCVLRKDRVSRFYGGTYAALPAGKLLLEAMRLSSTRTAASSQLVRAGGGVEGPSSAARTAVSGQ